MSVERFLCHHFHAFAQTVFLQCGKNNVLKDYITIAKPLHVTHLLSFSRSTTQQTFLRIVRLPTGPTLTFRVDDFELMSQVAATLKKQYSNATQYEHPPLLIMNGFVGSGMHLKLMSSMFQGMLPSINVAKVKLNSVRRCLLINYDAKNMTLDLRH